MKKKPVKEASCQCCGLEHKFDEPVKAFVCIGCGVGQTVVPSITAQSIAGRNVTGHYLPPSS